MRDDLQTETYPAGDAVRVAGLHAGYDNQPIFAGLDLHIPARAWTCILGASGVGKTTLLRLLAGLLPPTAGEITTGGRPLSGRVAYMAQQDLLLPWLTARQNVELGARLRGQRPDHARALGMLDRVGLSPEADRRPAALSGGQRQRVALARTLMENRPIVLMDEPFSALDAITRLRLQDLAAELLVDRTVVLITHDPLEALRVGHRIHIMHGQPAELTAAVVPQGQMPRDQTAPDIVALHRQLLNLLTGETQARLEGAA